ncbi:hypothetical protein ABL78_2720 [Leptomonas seymouri]|uniref:Transmembrane protein n=1 Tax=Leptomonas seymouri TaxID=5684 RepID=A0A0N0P6Z7_LEPSE|nr:hypothetical protein ABL78_2720 [Leptomonas seymouri]|eukprot:KPI88216.1 hypothetical protein ABL78_2720 [Leptomonas seymouri]
MRRLLPLNEIRAVPIWQFVVSIAAGLITVLFSLYWTESAVPDNGLMQLNAAIRAVNGAEVLKYLVEMNKTGIPRVFEPGRHPLYVVTCIPEEVTAEAQAIVYRVAYTFRFAPLDVDYAKHPLTAAYRHHRYKVAKILAEVWRQFPVHVDFPMSEVYASALSLAELSKVEPSVKVYCEDRDMRRCLRVIDPSRIQNFHTSWLERAYEKVHKTRQAPPPHIPFRDSDTPHRVVAPASTVRAGFWDDPFRPPQPDVLPPRSSIIMNPGYFSNPSEQLLYTLFGHVEGSVVLEGFILFSLSLTSFFLALWALCVVCWMVRNR